MFCIHLKKQSCIFFLLLLMACAPTNTTVVSENLPPTFTPSATETATATKVAHSPTATATQVTETTPTPPPPSPIIAQLSHLQEPVRHIVSRPSDFADPYLPDSNPNIGRDIALLNGRLWFASIAGLLAIDTHTHESKPYTTANGLPDNAVYELESCGAEQLFVGSETGLSLYNSQTDRFESGAIVGFPDTVPIHDMVCQNGRLTIAHDTLTVLNLNSNERTDYNQPTQHILWADEEIWLTTASNGLLRILPDGTTEVYNLASDNLPDDTITSIAQAPDGTFWFAGRYNLWQQATDGTWQSFDADNTPQVISYFGPKQIKILSNGSIWLTFPSSFCLFDPQQRICQMELTYQDLGLIDGGSFDEILFSEQAPIAFNTHHHGVGYFSGNRWQRYQLEKSLPTQYISQIYQDNKGTIWALGGDVYRLLPNGWEKVEELYAEHIAIASDGTRWFGGGYYSLQSYDQETVTDHSLAMYFNTLVVTKDDVVYAGGVEGYIILDRNSADMLTVVRTETHNWDMGDIKEMLYANETVYTITSEGLVSLDGESWQLLVEDTTLTAMASLPDGTILLGSDTELYSYQNGLLTANSQIIEPVKAIFTKENGQIWVVTETSGTFAGTNFANDGYLHWFDGTQWQVQPLSNGFPINGLRALYVDMADTIWIGFDGGLLHLKP